MAKFSIILPVRNGGEYFKECVQSILCQTYDDFNLLILDNCSEDGSLEWVLSISNFRIVTYPSTKVLSIEQNWARIKSIAKNEFMTMIGHDDILHPEYLMKLNILINEHPNASLYQAHFDFIDNRGDFIRDCWPMEQTQYTHEFLAAQMKLQIDSTGTGYMMRSCDFDAIGGMPTNYPNLIFSDYQLWISLMRLGYKATSPFKCFSYRIHQSVSHTTNGVDYHNAFIVYCNLLIELAKVDKKIENAMILYGKEFLYYYCESLSHRILKTPIQNRNIKVADSINTCILIAKRFIPNQDFKPVNKFRIWIAMLLDQNTASRYLFHFCKSIIAIYRQSE